MRQGSDLTPLFKREFELCNLAEGEVVGVLSDPGRGLLTSRPRAGRRGLSGARSSTSRCRAWAGTRRRP